MEREEWTTRTSKVTMDATDRTRYDRQLRVWGVEGQRRLAHAHVCLLGCGPCGTEALKNLVLGGVGAFTVVDGRRVRDEDLGNNFLLTAEQKDRPRARSVSEALQEMNGSVAGSYVEEEPTTLLARNPSFLGSFGLVLAAQMSADDAAKIDRICRKHGNKLVDVRACGLVATVRIGGEEHPVVEARPDNVPDDLRLLAPWPELDAYVDKFELEALDDATFRHVPYVVLLRKALRRWREEQGDVERPTTSEDRAQVRRILESMARQGDEDNFKEAYASIHKACAAPQTPGEVRAVLKDDAVHVHEGSTDFWFLVGGLKRFVERGDGQLPLDGSIPDMTSTTDAYLELQRLYRERASREADAVGMYVSELLQEVGRDPNSVSKETLKHFCKNARNVQVVRWLPLQEDADLRPSPTLKRYLSGGELDHHVCLYLLLRASDRFQATHGRLPGVYTSEWEEDVGRLKTLAWTLASSLGISERQAVVDDLALEVCRFGASELHALAAIAGGIASQEAIKLLTHQFVPLSGTLVFDGMRSTTAVLPL